MSYEPEDDNEARLGELRVQAASSDLTARAEAIEEMAFIHFQDGGVAPREKLPYIMAAIDLARSLGRERELGVLSNMASDVYDRLTEHEQAIEYALEALRIAREHMTSLYLTEVTSRLARLERRRGNFVLALDFYAQAHEAALDSGTDYFAGFAALLYSSQILGSMDLFDQAVDKADDAFHYARTHWNSACMSDALNEKAWCLYRLGSIDEMVEVLEEAAAHLESVLSPWSHEFLAINECAYELETKPSEATLQRLDALREVARERWNGNTSVAVINYLRAQYFAKVGEIEESLKLLRKIDLLRGSDFVHRFSAYTIQMQSVQFALSDGRHEQAAEFLRSAIACRPEPDDLTSLSELRIWLAEIELQAGKTEAALADLSAVPRDVFGVNEAGWMRQSRLLAKTLGSLQRHTESLIVANEVLSALYSTESIAPAQTIAAEMHELKARSLAAIGETSRARSEYEQARDAYAGLDDFASMARVSSLLKRASSEQPKTTAEDQLW